MLRKRGECAFSAPCPLGSRHRRRASGGASGGLQGACRIPAHSGCSNAYPIAMAGSAAPGEERQGCSARSGRLLKPALSYIGAFIQAMQEGLW